MPPPLSPFYDTPMPDDAEVGELFAAEPVADAPPEVRMYRILYVFYVRYPDDDHTSMNYQARTHQPSAIDYMKNIWDGEPPPDNCANQLLGTVGTVTGVN